MTDDIHNLIDDAIAEAKARWGDVPVSAELLHHEDGLGQITVFHTVYSDDARVGRVKLLWSNMFSQEYFEVTIPENTIRVDFHDLDEDVERLRSEDYWPPIGGTDA